MEMEVSVTRLHAAANAADIRFEEVECHLGCLARCGIRRQSGRRYLAAAGRDLGFDPVEAERSKLAPGQL